MAGKKIWLTWMPGGEDAPDPQETVAALGQYGFEVSGAPWVDDLEKVAWAELGGGLMEAAGPDVWLIAGRRADFEAVRNRYGLALTAIMVGAARGADLQGVCLGLDFQPEAEALPTPLGGFRCLDGAGGAWAAKLVAAAHAGGAAPPQDYRLNIIAHSMIGQWLEVGPRDGEWQGAMLGVSGEGEITHHAVGPAGQLPEKAVLEYPTQGIEAELGGTKFTAWAVQNALGPEDSYYVKIKGWPARLLFGGHPGTDQAEVTVLDLV